MPNEFLIVLNDGEDEDVKDEFGDVKTKAKARGAYYKNIERKMQLKKRRVNVSLASYTVRLGPS